MRSDKARTFVEPVRIDSHSVRGELYEIDVKGSGRNIRDPTNQCGPDTGRTGIALNSHRLHEQTSDASPGHPRDARQLHSSEHRLLFIYCQEKLIGRVGNKLLECQ